MAVLTEINIAGLGVALIFVIVASVDVRFCKSDTHASCRTIRICKGNINRQGKCIWYVRFHVTVAISLAILWTIGTRAHCRSAGRRVKQWVLNNVTTVVWPSEREDEIAICSYGSARIIDESEPYIVAKCRLIITARAMSHAVTTWIDARRMKLLTFLSCVIINSSS